MSAAGGNGSPPGSQQTTGFPARAPFCYSSSRAERALTHCEGA
jgi:hypothetical protein